MIYGAICLALMAEGRVEEPNMFKSFFRQISDTLHRITGMPGWCMAGALSGLNILLIAVIGFYWDVAWHLDFGRDKLLFTPAHVMILVGLGGLTYAAGVAVLFATIDRAEVGFRFLGLRIPWSALALGFLGIAGLAAFPIDVAWHKAYGLDVTLWSPSHLQLVSAGSFGTIAVWLMIAEGLPGSTPTLLGRGIHTLAAGATLVGMSTFQGEFDLGVPQFQLLYLPVLIAAAAGFALILARLALGRWGAIKATITYLILRSLLALAVGGALHHTTPRFPLYLPMALCVEAAAWWLGTENRLRFAAVAGALMGTVGLLAEMAFVELSGWGHTSPVLLPKVLVLGPLAAIAAGLLGAGLARAFSEWQRPVHAGVLVLAGLALAVSFAYPLPRNEGKVDAVIRLQRTGDVAKADVTLTPADAARRATALVVTAWQGGGTINAPLNQVGPGHYVTDRSFPVTGRWKAMVTLQRGDQVMAAPIYMPADREIGASAVPVIPERRVAFVRNTKVLLREAHGGPAWAAVAAFASLGGVLAIAISLFVLAARRVRPNEPPVPSFPTRSPVLAPS